MFERPGAFVGEVTLTYVSGPNAGNEGLNLVTINYRDDLYFSLRKESFTNGSPGAVVIEYQSPGKLAVVNQGAQECHVYQEPNDALLRPLFESVGRRPGMSFLEDLARPTWYESFGKLVDNGGEVLHSNHDWVVELIRTEQPADHIFFRDSSGSVSMVAAVLDVDSTPNLTWLWVLNDSITERSVIADRLIVQPHRDFETAQHLIHELIDTHGAGSDSILQLHNANLLRRLTGEFLFVDENLPVECSYCDKGYRYLVSSRDAGSAVGTLDRSTTVCDIIDLVYQESGLAQLDERLPLIDVQEEEPGNHRFLLFSLGLAGFGLLAIFIFHKRWRKHG